MKVALVVVGLFGVATEMGCYSEYAYQPNHCQAVYVQPHRGWGGRWHGGHWRCL